MPGVVIASFCVYEIGVAVVDGRQVSPHRVFDETLKFGFGVVERYHQEQAIPGDFAEPFFGKLLKRHAVVEHNRD